MDGEPDALIPIIDLTRSCYSLYDIYCIVLLKASAFCRGDLGIEAAPSQSALSRFYGALTFKTCEQLAWLLHPRTPLGLPSSAASVWLCTTLWRVFAADLKTPMRTKRISRIENYNAPRDEPLFLILMTPIHLLLSILHWALLPHLHPNQSKPRRQELRSPKASSMMPKMGSTACCRSLLERARPALARWAHTRPAGARHFLHQLSQHARGKWWLLALAGTFGCVDARRCS